MDGDNVTSSISGGNVSRSVTHLTNKWCYSGGKRDLRLDFLRGFAAVTMIIDHVGGKDSWLYGLSGGDRFFVSAAEGFVFISGLVMGIVYAGVIARQGLRAALMKGLKRVGNLYALTIVLSLAFAAIASQLGLPWAPHIASGDLSLFVIDILTLHQAFYLTDVLLLYTLVMAAAVPLLVLLHRGYGWLVLLASWALWTAWQWWPSEVQFPWAMSGGTTFNFSAWQVLFITGLVIGYHRKALEDQFARMFRRRMPVQLVLLSLSALVIGGSIAFYVWYQSNPGNVAIGNQLGQMFGKPDLRAGRLALFACLFVFAFFLSSLAWSPIRRGLGWLLLPMGQKALTVYTLHLFVVVLAVEAAQALLGDATLPRPDNTLLQAAAIFLIWGAVLLKTPARIAFANTYTRSKLWLSSRLPQSYAHRLRAVSPLLSRVVGLHSLDESRFGRLGVGALVLLAVVFVSAAPGFARTLRNGVGNAAGSLPMASSEPASPAPTGLAFSSPTAGVMLSVDALETGPDLGMLMGGTSVPASSAPTVEPVLPNYVEKRTFLSTSLNRTMPYYVYIPPGYTSNPGTRYPVLYMLHGVSGTFNEWLGYGLLGRARDMMTVGQISQFIIVLPQGDQGYWMDHAEGGPRWGSYVAEDVVNEVDLHFRTLADPQHRAIGGLSMGGYGALELAISYPGIFSIAGAHSPSLHTHDNAPVYFGDLAYFDAHDPVYLYRSEPDVARTLKLWIDDGKEDGWFPAIEAFHQVLNASGIAHEWNVYEGTHAGEYWSTHVPDYLQFYSTGFSSAVTPTAVPAASPTTRSMPQSQRICGCSGTRYVN